MVFVGTAVDELSEKLGYHFLQPRNRFWEQLELAGITPKRIITPAERKALEEGQARGNLADPIRLMFAEKRNSQLLRLGIGLAYLNKRVIATGEKDKSARPTDQDLQELFDRTARLKPRTLAFVIAADLFADLFRVVSPAATATPGPQAFTIGDAEVWLLGSTVAQLRGEALTRQEDAFFELGERLAANARQRPVS